MADERGLGGIWSYRGTFFSESLSSNSWRRFIFLIWCLFLRFSSIWLLATDKSSLSWVMSFCEESMGTRRDVFWNVWLWFRRGLFWFCLPLVGEVVSDGKLLSVVESTLFDWWLRTYRGGFNGTRSPSCLVRLQACHHWLRSSCGKC